ncbi:unnamed protein product [Adineta steineri]|uniref:Uncharacterized protein n=2 Tax=Adineta steineri TaxID=433720 RepID=A0A815XF36_9BILA|nr:unnamed protein product [Adineta steineri]CAF1556722.1 unnamed protein product [Adineta steineri]
MNTTNNTTVQDDDGCSLTADEIQRSYNLTLHVISVFVLLVVSFIGASISVASAKVKCLHIHPVILNTGKFFGSGVVLATGFIHILPDAMSTLSDPCLPDSWNQYGAYGGLFAMLAALFMQLLEFLGHQRSRSVAHKRALMKTDHHVKYIIKNEEIEKKTNDLISIKHVEDANNQMNNDHTCTHEINNETEDLETTHSIHNTSEKLKKKTLTQNQGNECENAGEPHNHIEATRHTHSNGDIVIDIIQIEPSPEPLDICEESAHTHGLAFQDDGQQNKISTYLLEFGIALHSVLIGLTLGTTTDSFVALFTALCFHQFFEAIALGAQIANLKTTSIKPAIYMIIFFSLTTPVGIAIGIGIHSGTYNPKSVSSLLITGILDSLSGGILIYVALVNLITAEMGANAHSFYNLSTRLKFLYFTALYLGAAAMAIIGRWA